MVTAVIVEPFLFTHWFDSSQSTLTDVDNVRITKIKMELTVQFGDHATARHFARKFRGFKQQNRHRDEYVDFFVSTAVDGFKKRLAVYTDPGNKSWWISSVWFWLATVFCLGWPYRIMFNHFTSKTYYSVVKVIFNKISSIPAIPIGAINTSRPPDNDEENVQDMIDLLIARLSATDEEMPIRCATTDEHVNVTLQEAHHTP